MSVDMTVLGRMRDRLLDTRILSLWLCASVICVVSGPFGTSQSHILERTHYWFGAIALGIVAQVVAFTLMEALASTWRLRLAPRMAGEVALFSAIYAPLLWPITLWTFGLSGEDFGFGRVLFYVAAVAAPAVAFIHLIVLRGFDAETEEPPRLYNRLEPSLRDEVVRMSMKDHYVEVRTVKGVQTILLRFADALDEIDGVEGWRIHRSHWVAKAHAGPVRSEGARFFMTTPDGEDLPVSRTYLPALTEAGLFRG